MSVAPLIEKITADTAATVSAIEAETATKVAAVEQATQTAIQTLRAEAVEHQARAQRQQETVTLSQARQAANIAWQTAKRSALDSIFQAAFDTLAGLPAAEYQALYQRRYQAVVPPDASVQRVVCPATRVAETAAILTTLGVSATPETDSACVAGLRVYTSDGVYDLTLERMFATERIRLEAEVSAALFS